MTATQTKTKSATAPESVLVATHLIKKGTPGNVVVRKGLYRIVKIPKNQVVTGAVVDPSALKGKIALADVHPGQQLKATEFGAATS